MGNCHTALYYTYSRCSLYFDFLRTCWVIAGTDDDLPPSHQNRIPRGGGRMNGNGRSAVMASVPYQRMYGETDMEAQIHQLEQEAYSSVLRAFKAQADAISWVPFVIP